MTPMAELLAHPLRLRRDGRLATVTDGSDDHHAQDIAVIIGTRPGERQLAPEFGVTDPTFDELDTAELVAQVGTWGPPRQITDVTTTYAGDGTATTVVTFT